MIYDCFPFFNELELLEIRLHELGEVVDRFVLVEATRTHSGQPKPLYYQQHRRRFSAWQSRIIHVVVEDLPAGGNPWVAEHGQRECIRRGLAGARPGDVILISDVDEIPRAEKVREYRDTPGIKVFQHQLAYYFLNNRADAPWAGTRMLSWTDFRRLGGAQAVRGAAGIPVADGGWHFSFMGGVRRIRNKLDAFAHQEYNAAAYTDPVHLSEALSANTDLFGRDVAWEIRPDCDLPQYVVDHRDRFADWIWDGPAFQEQWYDDLQCRRLAELYERVREAAGDVIEIGCWEGRSTAALANACLPETLLAVDTWLGSSDEHREHVTVQRLRERDVFRRFLRNMRLLTAGNVRPVVMHSEPFLGAYTGKIKFCHIDGSHDEASVRRDIAGTLRRLRPGGILCGDDFGPHAPGVTRAVEALLPGYEWDGKLWWWQKAAEGPSG